MNDLNDKIYINTDIMIVGSGGSGKTTLRKGLETLLLFSMENMKSKGIIEGYTLKTFPEVFSNSTQRSIISGGNELTFILPSEGSMKYFVILTSAPSGQASINKFSIVPPPLPYSFLTEYMNIDTFITEFSEQPKIYNLDIVYVVSLSPETNLDIQIADTVVDDQITSYIFLQGMIYAFYKYLLERNLEGIENNPLSALERKDFSNPIVNLRTALFLTYLDKVDDPHRALSLVLDRKGEFLQKIKDGIENSKEDLFKNLKNIIKGISSGKSVNENTDVLYLIMAYYFFRIYEEVNSFEGSSEDAKALLTFPRRIYDIMSSFFKGFVDLYGSFMSDDKFVRGIRGSILDYLNEVSKSALDDSRRAYFRDVDRVLGYLELFLDNAIKSSNNIKEDDLKVFYGVPPSIINNIVIEDKRIFLKIPTLKKQILVGSVGENIDNDFLKELKKVRSSLVNEDQETTKYFDITFKEVLKMLDYLVNL